MFNALWFIYPIENVLVSARSLSWKFVFILKNFFPLYFATLTSTSAKNMIDLVIMTIRSYLNLIYVYWLGLTRPQKMPPSLIDFICTLLKNLRGFCIHVFLVVKNEAAQMLYINEL